VGLLLLLRGVEAGIAAAFGVGLEGEGAGEGGRPIRARWEVVSGMSDIVSFAREGRKGKSARERFRRR